VLIKAALRRGKKGGELYKVRGGTRFRIPLEAEKRTQVQGKKLSKTEGGWR